MQMCSGKIGNSHRAIFGGVQPPMFDYWRVVFLFGASDWTLELGMVNLLAGFGLVSSIMG